MLQPKWKTSGELHHLIRSLPECDRSLAEALESHAQERLQPFARPTVAVDLDGLLARYEPQDASHFDACNIGPMNFGADTFVRVLNLFAEVMVNTARVSRQWPFSATDIAEAEQVHDAVKTWLWNGGFPADVKVWRGIGKPLACVYLDDRARQLDGVNLTYPRGHRVVGVNVWRAALTDCYDAVVTLPAAEASDHGKAIK